MDNDMHNHAVSEEAKAALRQQLGLKAEERWYCIWPIGGS